MQKYERQQDYKIRHRKVENGLEHVRGNYFLVL